MRAISTSFRGKRGGLVEVLWHDGVGMSLYAKRLDRDRDRFVCPSPAFPTMLRIAVTLSGFARGN